MKTRFKIQMCGRVVPVLMLMWAIAPARHALAQEPAAQQNSGAPASKPKGQQEANPFPDDSNVPVLPSANSPATPPSDATDYGNVALPGTDGDPVKSPDDAPASVDENSGSSSSSSGMDNLLKPPPDEEKGSKHRRLDVPDQAHPESAKEDENVGSYYLDQKNWKAALSRFESAVVLDPENPDVYWGLAEAQRHVGDYASAKANYLKVTEYDPDGKHGKEAKRILKEPELASAKAVSSVRAPSPQQQ